MNDNSIKYFERKFRFTVESNGSVGHIVPRVARDCLQMLAYKLGCQRIRIVKNEYVARVRIELLHNARMLVALEVFD